MRPIPYSHLLRSCLLAQNPVRGAPRYVTCGLIFLVSVNIIRADVRTTKKRKAKAANAKTKKEEAASRSKTPAGGKSFMKNRRLPMAIFKEKGESGDMDMEEDGNTVNEASTRHESVPKRRAWCLLFCLLTRSSLCSLAFPVN